MVRCARRQCFVTLLCLGATAFSARPAGACGGFFCTTFPMNQVGERILFVADGETVTTHVQIQYSGSAEDFAWILPVPDLPELDVSHNELFRQLQFATQPSFFLEWQENETCGFIGPPIFRTLEEAAVDDGGVQIVAEERVGPYQTAVITAEDPAAASAWLTANGYTLDALGDALLAPYVDAGFYFVALRLAPDQGIGDLQPIALTYAAEEPGIPIRLTAVATEPNMGVLVWVLGEHRAIPNNYLHVQINEARIDWFNGGFNYNDVVTEAADEAGGQAFVTDYAGPGVIMDDRLFDEKRVNLQRLREIDDPAEFLDVTMTQGLPRDDQMRALIRRHIPMSEEVFEEGVLEIVFGGDREAYRRAQEQDQLLSIAESSFYNNMRAYEEYMGDFEFDPGALVEDLQSVVVDPLRQAQGLFDQASFLTRLFTTLSAEEMTVDPMFSFNPDLAPVENLHSAMAHWECPDKDREEIQLEELTLVVTLKDGREIRSQPFVEGGPRPIPVQPAAAVVERMSDSGPPELIRRLTWVEAVSTVETRPLQWSLLPNYPNPFNSGTTIPFFVTSAGDGRTRAALRIYNLAGQEVRSLIAGLARPGMNYLSWDGTDGNGRALASGVYLARLDDAESTKTRKLLLLR